MTRPFCTTVASLRAKCLQHKLQYTGFAILRFQWTGKNEKTVSFFFWCFLLEIYDTFFPFTTCYRSFISCSSPASEPMVYCSPFKSKMPFMHCINMASLQIRIQSLGAQSIKGNIQCTNEKKKNDRKNCKLLGIRNVSLTWKCHDWILPFGLHVSIYIP